LKALKALADAGLTAALVLANLHRRWIIPLMERRLHVFEMEETADPVALVQSRLLPDLLPQKNAATRVRRVVNLKVIRNDDATLWSFAMLPEGPLVSRVPTPLRHIDSWSIVVIRSFAPTLQVMAVNAARPDPPTPRARAGGAQEGEEDPATGTPGTEERRVLAARVAGLSSPATSEYSSSDEEEESDGGQTPPRGGSLHPPRLEPRRRQRR
jgi:hypothetical protein